MTNGVGAGHAVGDVLQDLAFHSLAKSLGDQVIEPGKDEERQHEEAGIGLQRLPESPMLVCRLVLEGRDAAGVEDDLLWPSPRAEELVDSPGRRGIALQPPPAVAWDARSQRSARRPGQWSRSRGHARSPPAHRRSWPAESAGWRRVDARLRTFEISGTCGIDRSQSKTHRNRIATIRCQRRYDLPRAREPDHAADQSGIRAMDELGERTTQQVLPWSGGRGADAVLVCAASVSSAFVSRARALCRDSSAKLDGQTLWKGRQDKGRNASAAAFRKAVTGGPPLPTETMLATMRATIRASAAREDCS